MPARTPAVAESVPIKTLTDAERAHITARLRETIWVAGGPMKQPPNWGCRGQPELPGCSGSNFAPSSSPHDGKLIDEGRTRGEPGR
jgi:hypothetical protein